MFFYPETAFVSKIDDWAKIPGQHLLFFHLMKMRERNAKGETRGVA